jgi:hypothetical protein
METTIRNFERDTQWRVSLPARVVLQQLFIALRSDQLGTSLPVDQDRPDGRRRALTPDEHQNCQRIMIETLREFLNFLRNEADELLAPRGHVERGELTEIDAIFVVRHIRRWPQIADCLSVPV